MTVKPLTYVSLKTVIEYLEPNLRFQLALRIPSIRKIEKIVPLKIDKLEIRQHEITVNDVTYKLGVYRDYHNPNEILRKHLEDNEKGGVSQDLDEYGFIDKSSKEIIEPGDFVVEDDAWDIEDVIEDDRNAEDIAQELKFLIWLRAWRRGKYTKLDEKDRYFVYRIEYCEEFSTESVQRYIDSHSALLQPYNARRGQIPPPYTKLVQFTYGNEIYRKKTEQKLWQLQKQLTRRIFGQRKGPIQVEQLDINDRHMIVRLPSDMRINLRNLYTDANATSVLSSLSHLIDNSSLDQIEINRWNGTWTHLPIIQNAKLLVINYNQNGDDELFEMFRTITHQHVHFVQWPLTSEELVQVLMETRRSVGTCYTICTDLKIAEETYELLRNVENAKDVEKQCVTIPMSNTTAIMYSYILTPNEDEYQRNCRMKFEVLTV